MNKFERVSETEYGKVLASDCSAKNGVICVTPYENIKLPQCRVLGTISFLPSLLS